MRSARKGWLKTRGREQHCLPLAVSSNYSVFEARATDRRALSSFCAALMSNSHASVLNWSPVAGRFSQFIVERSRSTWTRAHTLYRCASKELISNYKYLEENRYIPRCLTMVTCRGCTMEPRHYVSPTPRIFVNSIEDPKSNRTISQSSELSQTVRMVM